MPDRAATPPRDPGLQPERTSLAWQRTVVSVTLASVVLALGQLRAGVPALAVAAAALAAVAVFPGVLRPRKGQGLVEPLRGARPTSRDAWPLLARSACVVAALGALGVVATLAHVLRA